MSSDPGSPFPSANPLQSPPPGSAPVYGATYQPVQQPRLSWMALSSFLIALVSPVFLCFCYPTLIGSLMAVVLGHVALVQIWRRPGEQWGTVWAALGLLVGYPMLLLCIIGLSIPRLDPAAAAALPKNPAKERLDQAELKITTDSNGVAHGNTPRAKELAEQFSSRMKALREELFTKSESKVQLSGGNFITYCELQDGRCAFIVHAPDLRHFSDDAEQSLGDLAWSVAQATVEDELEDGDQLAVGLKGIIFYGAVRTGKVGLAQEPKRTKNSDDLLPFFAPPPEQAVQEKPSDNNIKLDDQKPAAGAVK